MDTDDRPTSPSISRTLATTPAQRVRRALGVVTPLAWALAATGAVATIVGVLAGWEELVAAGVGALLLVTIALAFVIGRADLEVAIEVQPQRVTAGERAVAQITATNRAVTPLLGATMELTVGESTAEFRLPAMGPGGSHEELFLLPTVRRAVIPVGPATTVRSDPLGIMRRTSTWTDVVPLFVHPMTTPLAELGSGFVRDLEGQATNQVSQADVAFHTLRPYQPGDDRRFIHWLSTARAGELMVRQFVDTRRSHLAVVVDGDGRSYVDDEFETAVSVAGSLGRRVLLDQQDLSMVVAGDRIPTHSGTELLDGLAAVQTGGRRIGLVPAVDRLFRVGSGFSVAIVVSGRSAAFADLRAAAVRFPQDVRVLLLRVDHSSPTTFQPFGSHHLLTLGHLDDLAQLLWTAAP